MKRTLLLLLAGALLTAPLSAEILIFSTGELDRGASRFVIFNGHPRGIPAGESEFLGQVVVHFGKPQWKPEYKEMMNHSKQEVWRLGSDYWTTLETNLPIRLGGKGFAPGQYFLAAKRSSETGSWKLLVLDPGKVRAARLDPIVMQFFPERYLKGDNSPLLAEVPLKASTLEQAAEKMSVVLTSKSNSPPAQATLAIRWGETQLAVDLEAEIPMTASE